MTEFDHDVDRSAVICLSGGADSSTLLGWWLSSPSVDKVFPISFDYRQKHVRELAAGALVLAHYAELYPEVIQSRKIFHIGEIWGDVTTAPLLNPKVVIPDQSDNKQVSTVVPFRNTILIAIAAGYAETVGAANIVYGMVKEDIPAYRDCRPEYVSGMSKALYLGATEEHRSPILHAPFNTWSKAQIVEWGLAHDVPYHLTHTCYEGTTLACGKCDACAERIQSFRDNGVEDPIPYAISIDW